MWTLRDVDGPDPVVEVSSFCGLRGNGAGENDNKNTQPKHSPERETAAAQQGTPHRRASRREAGLVGTHLGGAGRMVW